MGVRGLGTAQQARLRRHVAEMLLVPKASRLLQKQDALVHRGAGLRVRSRGKWPVALAAVGGGRPPFPGICVVAGAEDSASDFSSARRKSAFGLSVSARVRVTIFARVAAGKTRDGHYGRCGGSSRRRGWIICRRGNDLRLCVPIDLMLAGLGHVRTIVRRGAPP